MGHWSELPEDLLHLIEDSLVFYVDKVRIRAICVSWNSYLPNMRNHKERQFPWLFQALDTNKDASHALFNPMEKKRYLLDLPEFRGMLFKGSSHGWVVALGGKDDFSSPEVSLINPLTRVQIKLPSRTTFTDVVKYRAEEVGKEYCLFNSEEGTEFVHFYGSDEVNFLLTDKFVLSSAPCGDDCLIAAIYGPHDRLAYCKLKDKTWTPLLQNFKAVDVNYFADIIFYKGKLHALQNTGRVLVFENNGIGPNSKVTEIARELPVRERGFLKYLVVSSDGGLIMVARFIDDIETTGCRDSIPRTYRFKAYKLNSINLTWVEVNNLGDDILFVGLNSSFSISSRDYPEYEKNHVYFTDSIYSFGDFVYTNRKENSDTGVFNLEDDTLQSLPGFENNPKFVWPPPLWVNIG